MRIQAGIPRCPSQALIVSKRYMLIGPWVFVSLRQPVVHYMNIMLLFADSYQIIVGLDIAMKETSRVDVLNALDQLVRQHKHGVQVELSMAVVE